MQPGQALLSDMEKIKADYDQARKTVARCEDELTDIEHFLELSPVDRKADYQAAKRIRDLRKQRREAKDRLELLFPIVDAISRNDKFKLDLQSAVTKAALAEKAQKNRRYYPKVPDGVFVINEKIQGDE